MIDVNVLWVEKYRPQKIKDCILPDNIKSTFQSYVDKKEVPNLLLCGGSGVGKTTVARAMLEEIGCDYILINGSDESGIDTLRIKIKGFASAISLLGGRKAVIIDEADYLTPTAQAAFRGVIEEFAGNCAFIFTCNFKNRIIEPLHSRCAVIDFKIPAKDKAVMATEFFNRINYILSQEGILIEDQMPVLNTIGVFFPDYRRILNELQRFCVGGFLNNDILNHLNHTNIDELMKFLKAKDFRNMRKWVAQNTESDSVAIMRQFYDRAYEFIETKSIPVLVVILGKYMYQAGICRDQEVNLAACFTELMVETQFK